MALDFPSAPDPGDTFSAVGKTWKWDGITWKLEGLNNDYTLSAQDGSSTKKHIRLSNTVDTYDVTLVAGQNITLNRNVNEIEIVSSGSGVGSSTFLALTDTPNTLQGGKWLKCNTGGTALEWTDEPTGSGGSTYTLAALLSPGIELLEDGVAIPSNRVFFDGGTGITVTRTNTNPHTIEFSSSLGLNDLSDVSIIGTPVDGAVIKYDSSSNSGNGGWILGSDNVSGGGSGVGNLQQVTDNGNTTTNSITTKGLAMGSYDGANNKITLGDNFEGTFFYQQSTSEFITQVNNGNDWLVQITPNGSFKIHGYQSTEMLVAGDNGTKLYHKSGGTANPVSSLRLETTILGAKVTGELEAGGNKYPISTGNPNEVLMTNGAGQLSWTAQTGGGGGGLQNVVEDTTPQLGGPLYTNGHFIETGDSTGPNNDRLKFGLHDDLHIYHDGTTSIIKETKGDFDIISIPDSGGPGDISVTSTTLNWISDTSTVVALTSSGMTITGSLTVGGILDKDNDLGNPGQILSSTGTQLNWIDAPTGGNANPSIISVPVFDQSESTSGGTYSTNTTYGGGNTVTYANTGANRHVDVKFEKLDNDKIYEFVVSYGSNGTDPYYGWYFADKQTTRSDNNGPTDPSSNKKLSDKVNGVNTTTDHWKCYSRVNATDRYITGDPISTGTTWNWPANGIEWDPMQLGAYNSPQSEVYSWHFVIDMPRNKIWVKEYSESWQNGDTGVFKVGSTTQGDPTDPLTTPSLYLRKTGTGDYYFNVGMFIPSDGTGSCSVYAIKEEYSAFRHNLLSGSSNSSGGATTFLALTDTPNSWDNEKWLRSTTSGLEWVNAPTGEENVKSDWDATSGDAEILNKPTNVSEFTNDAGYKTTDSDTTYTIDLIQSGNTPVADEVKLQLTAGGSGSGTDIISFKAGDNIEFEGLNANGSDITIKSTASSSVSKFTDLNDTPSTMSSAAGMYLKINATENGIEYANVTSGGGGINNVVEDTTPQLGGNLDVNGKSITSPTGTMYIDAYNIVFRDTFNGSSSYKFAEFNYAGPTTVKLYGGLAERFKTTQSGCKVTGELEVTGNATANLFIGDLQGNADTATNLNTSSANKQLLYQIDGTTTGLLPAGTSGWILQSQGSGNAPAWVENTASGSFTDLSDTPSSHDSGKWLKSNGSNLIWADEPQGLPQGGASLNGKILRHNGTEWVIADLLAGGGIDIETNNNNFTINGMLVLQMQSFSGTGYHYPHAKTKGLLVVLVGGGGGSGSATGNSSFSAGTGGGGGAAAAVYFYTRDQYTNAQNQGGYYSCGSGGAGGVGQNDNGEDGGESTLQVSGTGPTLRASGGKGSAGTGPGNYSYGGVGGSHPYGGGAWPHHICFGVAGGHSTGYGANAKEGEPGITNAPGCSGANWGSGGGGIKSNSGNTNNGNSGVGGRIDIYEF